jgi:hypothetical protein
MLRFLSSSTSDSAKGKDQRTMKFVSRMNENLKSRGCSGRVEIGEEMADLSFGQWAE